MDIFRDFEPREKNDLVRANFTQAEAHRVLARRSNLSIPVRVAYEDMGLARKGIFTEELIVCKLEEDLEQDTTAENHTTPDNGEVSSDRG